MSTSTQRGLAKISDRMASIDQIELEILKEYDRSGTVDVADWVARYPEYRDQILEFWLWARPGAISSSSEETKPLGAIDAEVAEKSLRDAALAINLGAQWLK